VLGASVFNFCLFIWYKFYNWTSFVEERNRPQNIYWHCVTIRVFCFIISAAEPCTNHIYCSLEGNKGVEARKETENAVVPNVAL
jgi:hypothetical protein